VNFAPVVTTPPASLTVNENHSAIFRAAATGSPTPTVQWQVSADAGVSWANIPGATGTTLSFTARASDDGEQYRAVFTNSLGPTPTAAATLTVNIGPEITVQPVSQTVPPGAPVSFAANASGKPTPTVRWQVYVGASWTDVGSTSPVFTFTAALSDSGRRYRAIFTNSAGTATTAAATLTVGITPAVTLSPVSQTVTDNQSVTFSAAASGAPAPTVRWQVSRNGGSTWSSITGGTAPTLTFTAHGSDNGALYRAVFTNGLGSATTAAATLTVNTAPVITTQPSSRTVYAGTVASFVAAANGNPTPTVQWQVSTDAGATWTDLAGATTTTLSFTAQTSDNGKRYRAVFTNVAGTATTKVVTLTVR
jgi:hypothetical protein